MVKQMMSIRRHGDTGEKIYVKPKDSDEGRRSGWDRRQFRYTAHIPERRGGADRRSGAGEVTAL